MMMTTQEASQAVAVAIPCHTCGTKPALWSVVMTFTHVLDWPWIQYRPPHRYCDQCVVPPAQGHWPAMERLQEPQTFARMRFIWDHASGRGKLSAGLPYPELGKTYFRFEVADDDDEAWSLP
jgi:hypothetical protein